MDFLIRTELLIGKAAAEKLRASHVTVFGVGGVGSFAVEALARAGVGNLMLVDHDKICESNINRQIHAFPASVGRLKVEEMKERVTQINPSCRVKALAEFVLPETLILPETDYIIDAIDTVTSKIALAKASYEKGTRIISSMGAANKLHPEAFRLGDIYETTVCPLAKVMRRELKKHGVPSLAVCYSTEPPLKISRPEADGKSALGSISFVPSAAGLIIAGKVVRDLIS